MRVIWRENSHSGPPEKIIKLRRCNIYVHRNSKFSSQQIIMTFSMCLLNIFLVLWGCNDVTLNCISYIIVLRFVQCTEWKKSVNKVIFSFLCFSFHGKTAFNQEKAYTCYLCLSLENTPDPANLIYNNYS